MLPDPLHPALVHFPIALAAVALPATLAGLFWRRLPVLLAAAMLWTAASGGAWAAIASGESDEGAAKRAGPQARALLEEHELWAEVTAWSSSGAAVLAGMAAVLLGRAGRVSLALAALAATAGAVAGGAVFRAGHLGGAMVYRHGVGVGAPPAASAASIHKEDD